MRLGLKKRFKTRGLIAILALLLCTLTAFYVTAERLNPAFTAQAHAYANTMVTDVIEKAVNEVLSSNDYSETSKVHDSFGVTSIEADTVKMNKLKSELTVKIQNDIAARCNTKIYIPIGSASGLYLLSGMGPKIPVSICPAAIVNTNYEESFESAGINQVRHQISVNVDVKMQYSGYMLNECETINTDVLVMESIITGAVPQYYGGMGILPQQSTDDF